MKTTSKSLVLALAKIIPSVGTVVGGRGGGAGSPKSLHPAFVVCVCCGTAHIEK